MAQAASAPPASGIWTVGALVKWATDDFRTRGMSSPRLDAELIVGHVTGLSRTQMIMEHERPLSAAELAPIRELVKRRRSHEPIAYLRGVREFYGREFKVDARVLVPRPETELLVDCGLRRTESTALNLRALDLCTGSGCVGITIARERPTARVTASDISDGALSVARDNAARLGAYNMGFLKSDLFASLGDEHHGSFDLIVSNPPYIETSTIATLDADVREHEPHLALDGGADGYEFYKRIVAESPTWLHGHGVLALEVGAGQAPTVAEWMRERGFADVLVERDLARIERVVSGVWLGDAR